MDDDALSALEHAVSDLGALLVRARKYAPISDLVAALDREARTLGGSARRLLRRDALGPDRVQELLAVVAAIRDRALAAVDGVVQGPTYALARRAFAAGDDRSLAEVIPAIFADVARDDDDLRVLYRAAPWTRRGRALPVTELVAALDGLRRNGFTAEGDDLGSGADPALPAIAFAPEPPEDELLVLGVEARAVPSPVFRHGPTETLLIYRPEARLPFDVRVAASLDLDAGPADYPTFRADLAVALRSAGFTVRGDGNGADPSR